MFRDTLALVVNNSFFFIQEDYQKANYIKAFLRQAVSVVLCVAAAADVMCVCVLLTRLE